MSVSGASFGRFRSEKLGTSNRNRAEFGRPAITVVELYVRPSAR